MKIYDSILKQAKAEGYGEDEVRQAVTDGMSELFLRTKQKGIDDEVVKAKLDTFGLPPELYTRPEDAGGGMLEKAKGALEAIQDPIKAAGKALAEMPGQIAGAVQGAAEAPSRAISEPSVEIPAFMKKLTEEYGIKLGATMAKEQMEKVYGPTAAHYMNAYASGIAANAADLGRTAQWLGFDAGQVVSERARVIEKELADPRSLDRGQDLAKSVGYLSAMFMPGVGIEAGVASGGAKLAAAAPRIAAWLGVSPTLVTEAMGKAAAAYMATLGKVAPTIAAATGASEAGVVATLSTVRMLPAAKVAGMAAHTAMGAGVNAGAVYERSISASPEEKELANARASAVFWGSLPVSLIASHFFPAGTGGVARQAFQGALSQGSVVASWHMLSNMAMSDPILSGVLHSFANGAIFGSAFGAAGAVMRGVPEGPVPVTEPPAAPPSRMRLTAEGQAPKAVTPELVPTPMPPAPKVPPTKAKPAATKPAEPAPVVERAPSTPSKPIQAPSGFQLKSRYGVEGENAIEAGGQWGDVVKGSAKAQFKDDSLKMLKAVGKEIGLEGKPSFNAGGPAVSGDGSGTFLGPDGNGVYIAIGQTGVETGRPHAQGITILYRAASKDDPYGTRSTNFWLPGDTDSSTLAGAIQKMLKTEKPYRGPKTVEGPQIPLTITHHEPSPESAPSGWKSESFEHVVGKANQGREMAKGFTKGPFGVWRTGRGKKAQWEIVHLNTALRVHSQTTKEKAMGLADLLEKEVPELAKVKTSKEAEPLAMRVGDAVSKFYGTKASLVPAEEEGRPAQVAPKTPAEGVSSEEALQAGKAFPREHPSFHRIAQHPAVVKAKSNVAAAGFNPEDSEEVVDSYKLTNERLHEIKDIAQSGKLKSMPESEIAALSAEANDLGPKVIALEPLAHLIINGEEVLPVFAKKFGVPLNPESPYAGTAAQEGSRYEGEEDMASTLDETEIGVSHQKNDLDAVTEMLSTGKSLEGKPLKPAQVQSLESEKAQLEGDIEGTLTEVEQAAGEDVAEKMRQRTGLPSAKPAKQDLKTKKARATLDVEGEASHGQQFEVQDDVGEVAVRPPDGGTEPGEGPEGGAGVPREGEPPVRPGGGGAAVPADAFSRDTRLSVEKPIELTPSQRKDLNAKALAILDKSTDQITEADREVLRQYTGVGGLQAEEEGVLNQHYTSYPVIKFMWDKLAAMGVPFKGVKALEAAEGVGNFLGFKPEGVEFDAIELDDRASRVASILYPNAKHHNMPFEKFVPSYGYDISIGNDPFGDFRGKERYADEAAVYSEIGAIHDFFIMKRVDLLNPNGVLAVITSTGTMDKSDPKTRARINAKAEFLGAYRLPQGTFKKNAGFEGSVDVMFFRKRVAEEIGKKELLQSEFIETDTIQLKGTGGYEQEVNISGYYKAHPEKMLGTVIAGGRYSNRAEVKNKASIQEILAKILNDDMKLTPKATKIAKSQGGYIEDQPNLGDAKPGAAVGSYAVKDNKLVVVGASGKLFDSGKSIAKAEKKVRSALEMMELADKLMAGVRENGVVDKAIQKKLATSARLYFKDFKTAPGYDRSLKVISDDPRYFKLAGIMDDEGKPADILTKDNIFPEAKKIKPAKKGDLADAIRYAKESGKLNEKAVAEAYGKPLDEVRGQLVKSGWNQVGQESVPDEVYLVGDLWPKIDAAREAGFQEQVQKLMAALPEQKTIKDVPASLLHAWLPPSARDGFLAHAGIGGQLVRAINPENGRLEWRIDGGGRGVLKELAVNGNTPAETVLKYLNHQKEYKADPEDYRARILDREATEKLKVVDQEFEKYLRVDAPDKEAIVAAYNRAFRSYKRPSPDSSPADLPGISATFKGRPLVVKSHQWEWVRMATEQRASTNAHGVGGGKTMAGALAGQMASVQNGAKRKLFIVPAKVIQKWAYEIQQLFPGAKVFSLEDLSSSNAYKMLQQVAMNEFDFALISHDRLKMIPMKSSEKYLEEDLAQLRDRLVQMKKSKGKKNLRTERDVQERLVKMEEKLRGLQQMAKTKTIWWEDLNIDLISVDEAHNYKRVDVDYGTYANESHISGGNQSSDRANDLWYKTREMRDRKKGNIHFLTATPTTNRPIEIYSHIRFLNPEEWTNRGIMNAQDFIDYFAIIEPKLVPDLDGVLVEKTLITGYKNLHDLRAIVGKYVDYRPVADLKEVLRPEGSYTVVEVPISQVQMRILAKIVADLEYVTKDPRGAQAAGINKMSLTTAGRQAAVGADIYDAETYRGWEDKNSKIAFTVDKVMDLHKKHGAGQLIFLDMFRGYQKVARLSEGEKAAMKAAGEKVKLQKPDVLVNYHERIRDLLVKRGIKAKDIAIVNGEVNNTPALKQKLAEDYNAGRLKVVIGTTSSMGEGMDLQADTVAIHNMDVPWTPAALEQRNGRGLRQGNKNELVSIFYYQTKGSLDAFMFGKLAVKDKWNQNLWTGKEDTMSNSLNNDEVEGIDYEDQSKNLTVDRPTLEYWKKVRERDIEIGLQGDRLRQIETLEHRIESRHGDIKHSQQMIETYRQRLVEDTSAYSTELNTGRIETHTNTIQTLGAEIQTLQTELDTLNAAQEQGKAKLVMPIEPGTEPEPVKTGTPQVPAMEGMAPMGMKPRSLGSAAASDFEGQEPPAETLQPDQTEDPDGVDRALAGPPPPPRPPKPTKKGLGGRPEKPGRGFSFENKEAEERYAAARKGISAPTLVEQGKVFLREIWASMTTEFEGLPRTPQFSRARYELHRVQKQSAVAQDRAIRIVEDIARPMDDVDLEIFQRTILLRDLAREDLAGHELPFGFEPGEPQKELDRLKPILDERERAWSGIVRRQSVWDGIKADYIKAMADIGFNVADRLKNEDYFRHQVLLYANGGRDFRVRSGGLRAPTGRGFLKKRGGSQLDINANYAQAEFEVMAQMMKDIEVAKAIRTIKDTYDISKDLKNQAKQVNQQAMEQIMASEEPVTMIGTQAVGPTELQMRQYGQNIARGFQLVNGAILERQIDPALAAKWESVIANFEAQGSAADVEGPEAPEVVRPTDHGVFKFLAELANTEGAGAMGARIVFKAIAARKQFLKTTLGDNYKEWRDLLPETHALWQPREGNIFYFVDTVPAKLAAQIHNEVAESVGITKKDLAKALAMGGPRAEYAIPVQLADALDAFNSPVPENRLGATLKVITSKWKQWQLISPRRVIKYNIRNLSGDADAVFVGNPDTFRFVPDAITDLRPVFFSAKTPEGELREFFQRGGFETTLRAQEIADLKDVEILSRLFEEKDKTIAEKGLDAFKKGWGKMALATDFRETILRYAAYRSFLAQLEGEGLKNYGASIKEEVDALPDNRDRAFKMANDLLGAYDEVSVTGQWLREHLLPFWSWKEVNFRRYVQLFKNATMEGDAEMGSRMARQLGSTGARQGARAAAFLLKATAAWVLMELYNHLVWPKEEAELDEMTRNRAHIILWRESDGRVAYFSGVGALGDILSWFGADAAPLMIKDFLNGKRTATEVAKAMGRAPFNIVANMITPLIKMPAELAAQKQFYPDVFNPRPIRDNSQYLMRSIALGDEYNALFGVPSRGYIDSLKNMLYYRMDPGQGSFLDISTAKRKFMEKQGIAYDGGHTSPKGEALYNYKLALRYDDKELAGKFLKQYITLGGKAAQLKQSLLNMGPLAGLSMRQRAQFLHTLNQDDRIRLVNAKHYWREILMGRKKE